MNSFAKTLCVFAFPAFALLTTASGCSEIGEAIDCDQMCEKMQTCIDSEIDVHECAESCEDRVDDNSLAEKLDACTDCMDHGYSCNEIVDECSACDDVQIALLR